MEKSSKLRLGGAGLVDNSQAVKGSPLSKPTVGFVNGTAPSKPTAEQPCPTFSHSPLKVKGK